MNLKDKRGFKEKRPSLEGFVRYYIRFQVDHVWTMRVQSFVNLKDKRGLKES